MRHVRPVQGEDVVVGNRGAECVDLVPDRGDLITGEHAVADVEGVVCKSKQPAGAADRGAVGRVGEHRVVDEPDVVD